MYGIIQIVKLKLYPKQDNVHYVFSVGTTEEKKKPIIEYVKLNDKKLLSKYIREIKSPYVRAEANTYQIIIPFKKGKEYRIEIKTIFPPCMSDLSDEEEYDFHEYTYFALTERTFLKHKYDFPNFDKYDFKAEKRYMNLPDVEVVDCKVDYKRKEVIVESGNLKNGDKIYLTYIKK